MHATTEHKPFDPFTLADRDARRPYEDALDIIAEHDGPISRTDVFLDMNRRGHAWKWRGLPRVLRELRAAGYLAFKAREGWAATGKHLDPESPAPAT